MCICPVLPNLKKKKNCILFKHLCECFRFFVLFICLFVVDLFCRCCCFFLGGLTFLELIIVGLLVVFNQFYEVAFDVDTKCFALI